MASLGDARSRLAYRPIRSQYCGTPDKPLLAAPDNRETAVTLLSGSLRAGAPGAGMPVPMPHASARECTGDITPKTHHVHIVHIDT